MTLQLDWPAEVIGKVSEEARQVGLSLDEFVLRAVLRHQPNASGRTGGGSEAERREQAGRGIRELREAQVLGPELSIRDLIEEVRRFRPLSS